MQQICQILILFCVYYFFFFLPLTQLRRLHSLGGGAHAWTIVLCRRTHTAVLSPVATTAGSHDVPASVPRTPPLPPVESYPPPSTLPLWKVLL